MLLIKYFIQRAMTQIRIEVKTDIIHISNVQIHAEHLSFNFEISEKGTMAFYHDNSSIQYLGRQK